MKGIYRGAAFALITTFALTACGGGDSDSNPLTGSSSGSGGGGDGKAITVGSANFPENQLLAEIYAGALAGKGVKVDKKLNIGSRETYIPALEDGSIDLIPEYTGVLAQYFNKDAKATDADGVYKELKAALPPTLTVLDKSAAEDKDAVVVTKETADKYKLKSIADLKAVAGDLTLTAPPEFKGRPQGIPGLEKTYGVKFGSFRPLTGQGIVQALKNGQADAANIFSTDPAIAANGFVQLEDTKKLFGSQNIVPLVRVDRADEVKAALNAVSAKLTTEAIAGMLKETDIDKKDPKAVAAEFLSTNGLG